MSRTIVASLGVTYGCDNCGVQAHLVVDWDYTRDSAGSVVPHKPEGWWAVPVSRWDIGVLIAHSQECANALALREVDEANRTPAQVTLPADPASVTSTPGGTT